MYYSFDFAANVTRLCIEEIRNRGLQERKIFCKTMPNNGLLNKVFNKQICTSEDLAHVHILSVATLMQDALWSTHERIVSKKSWRTINYETCTLSRLSSVISSKAEKLLIDILDFLVELIQYKSSNLMDAYRIGDALGKVVLGPADCGPIIQEKAGHFLTRMIIEHAKINQQKLQAKQNKTIRRIDSGISCHSFYHEHNPICKSQGTQARAKFYNRAVSKTKRSNSDWIESTIGVQCMFDNDYDLAPEPPAKPWTSIFTASTLLIKRDMNPILFRILMAASKPTVPPIDLASSHVLTANKRLERQIKESFIEFSPQKAINEDMTHAGEKANPLKKLNHSLSHLKLNIKKYRSRHDLLDESFISQDTEVTIVDEDQHEHQQPISDYNIKATSADDHPTNTHSATVNMKKAMRKMIKIGTINYHKEKFNSKIVV